MRSRRLFENDAATQTDLVFLEDGRPAELPGFDPHFGHWIAELREQKKSRSTVCTYVQALLRCIATLQSICGTEVTVQTISSLDGTVLEKMQQRMLEEGAKDQTILLRMAALRSFAKFLNKYGCARCGILLASRLPHLERRLLHTPGKEDCNNLLLSDEPEDETWQTLRNRAVLRLISVHGLTMAEILTIDREDLCLADHTLYIAGRGCPRTIAVETDVVESIVAYMDVCPHEIDNGSALFVGTRSTRLSPRVVQRATSDLRNQLGLHKETTPRAIRKSRVLQLVASGVSIQEIMQRVGISASAIGLILREKPFSPLEMGQAIRKVHSILDRLRPVRTDDNAAQRKAQKTEPITPRLQPKLRSKSDPR